MKLYICYEDKGTSGICGMDYSPCVSKMNKLIKLWRSFVEHPMFKRRPKDNIYFEIQNNPNDKAVKKASSFNQIIPSEDMTDEEYNCFLVIAKPYEMELDIISRETYYEICKQFNKPIPKPYTPSYRGRSLVYENEQEALAYAAHIEKEISILEYGISSIDTDYIFYGDM